MCVVCVEREKEREEEKPDIKRSKNTTIYQEEDESEMKVIYMRKHSYGGGVNSLKLRLMGSGPGNGSRVCGSLYFCLLCVLLYIFFSGFIETQSTYNIK